MAKYFITLLLTVALLQACIPGRALLWGNPDIKDSQRFKNREVEAPETCFFFEKSTGNLAASIKVNDHTTNLPVFRTIKEILDEHASRAFLLIKNDSILLEYYRDDLDKNSLHPSYSVAKAFTSALTGFAVQEGHLESEEELVVKYIPELAVHPEAQKLKIVHLLNMTSGIAYSMPQDAQLYYGKDLMKAIQRMKFEASPGTVQRYLNLNIQLLGMVVSRATGKTLSAYLSEKIWQPLGMESSAQWSIDEKNGLEKSYCCLNASARDFAKFGRLFLEKGDWNGRQLLDSEWVEKSIRRDTLEGSSFHYNYCWHIGLKAYGDFIADGMYKQYIYIHPGKKIIMVALNEKEKKLKSELVKWPYIFRQVVDQL